MACSFCPHAESNIVKWVETDYTPCELLVVGESPGYQEINTNIPFPGDSGALIRQSLVKQSIDLKCVGFTHAMHCTQGGDKKKTIPKCIVACRDRLVNEVSIRRPKVIAALGSNALWALMNDKTIKVTKCIGDVLVQPETGIPIIAIVHPAALQHNGALYKDFEAGFRNLGRHCQGMPKPHPGGTKYIVATEANRSDVEAYIKKAIKETHLVAADIETTGLRYINGDRIKQLGLCFKRNEVIIFRELTPFLLELLQSSSDTLRWIWHNGKFDVGFLRFDWGARARVDEDTMLMHYALDERKGTHDLETLATQRLGAKPWSDVMSKYWKEKKDEDAGGNGVIIAEVPQETLDVYHSFDCDYTWQLYHHFTEELSKDRAVNTAYRYVMIPGSEFLTNLERNGFWVNLDYHAEVSEKVNSEIEEVNKAISYYVESYWNPQMYALQTGAKKEPKSLNIKSPKQLQWLLYERMKFKCGNGMYNTRADTLDSLHSPIEDGLMDLPEYLLKKRKLDKLKGTYIDGLPKHIGSDRRVHSNYLIHGTVTGRLASRNPNMQNIPRDSAIKSLFQAPSGRILIEADYMAAELRCLCYLSFDREMRRIFMEGLDLHDEMSLTMFGEGFTQEQRVMAKTINFGIPYGRSAWDIARTFDISTELATDLVNAWFRRFPQAAKFIRDRRRDVTQGRVIISPFGRKRRFGLTNDVQLNAQQNEAVNFPISSMSADLTLLSGVELEPIMREQYDTLIVNEVHDSMIFEAPEDSYEEQYRVIASVMRKKPLVLPNGDFVPFDVEIKIGKEWGNLKKIDRKLYATA